MLKGLDVSHAQGFFDWEKAKADGYVYAFVKSTEGLSFNDPQFHRNWENAQANGFYLGAYHFFHPNVDAVKQADFFLKSVGPKISRQLPFVLDLEVTNGVSAYDIINHAAVFLSTIEAETKTTPMVYCSRGFVLPLHLPASFAKYPLWEAEYEVAAPKPCPPWPKATFWQYAEDNGLDKDEFFGDINNLKALVI